MTDDSDSDMSEIIRPYIHYHAIEIMPTTDEASVAFYRCKPKRRFRMMLNVKHSVARASSYGNRRVSTAPHMEKTRIAMLNLTVPKAFMPVVREPGHKFVKDLMRTLYRRSAGDTVSTPDIRMINPDKWKDYTVEETVSLSVVHSIRNFDPLEIDHDADEFFGLYISIDPIFEDCNKELIKEFLRESVAIGR
jgi:hypothetical protein